MRSLGEALGSFLWLGGWSGRLVLMAGLAGIALSIASALSLFVPPLRAASKRLGTITLLAAATTMGLAAAATWAGRAEVDKIANASPREPRREKLVRDGYTAARVLSLGGLVLGALPLVAGVGAVMSGRKGRGAAALAQGGGVKRPLLAGSRAEARARAKVSLPVAIAIALAIIAAILALWGAQASIPGDELAEVAGLAPQARPYIADRSEDSRVERAV